MMFSMAVCDGAPKTVDKMRSLLEDYLVERNTVGSGVYYSDPGELIRKASDRDIYLFNTRMDGLSGLQAARIITEKNPIAKIIFLTNEKQLTVTDYDVQYISFLNEPIEKVEFFDAMDTARRMLKEECVWVKVPNGSRRIKRDKLKYVDIQHRSLSYHIGNEEVVGLSVRSSFSEVAKDLINLEGFYWMKPSLIVNLGLVKEVSKEKMVFEDGETLYYPKNHHKEFLKAWKEYSPLIDLGAFINEKTE